MGDITTTLRSHGDGDQEAESIGYRNGLCRVILLVGVCSQQASLRVAEMRHPRIEIPADRVRDICRRHHICWPRFCAMIFGQMAPYT
jgi:hypothetical protein